MGIRLEKKCTDVRRGETTLSLANRSASMMVTQDHRRVADLGRIAAEKSNGRKRGETRANAAHGTSSKEGTQTWVERWARGRHPVGSGGAMAVSPQTTKESLL